MAGLSALFASLSTKGAASAVAATLLVGGGVAVAQNATLTADDEVTLTDEEASDLTGGVEDEPDMLCPDAAEVGLDTANPAGNPDEPGDCPPDEAAAAADEGDNARVQEVPETEFGDLESLEDDEPEDERSDTAKRVHRALTWDQDGTEGIEPGPGFGAAVSKRARSGHLGPAVSAAARNDPDWENGLELEPKPDNGNRGEGPSGDITEVPDVTDPAIQGSTHSDGPGNSASAPGRAGKGNPNS